jgi:hypothetical protein
LCYNLLSTAHGKSDHFIFFNLPSEAHFKLVVKIPAWGIPERWRASKLVREELLFSKEDMEKDPQCHVAPLKKLKSAQT